MISNIHQRIGWFNCANLRCRRELGIDYVTLTTTAHLRRFCSVYCVAEGLEAWMEHLGNVPNGPEREDIRAEAADWSQRVYEAITPASPPCKRCGVPVEPNARFCRDCSRATAAEIVGQEFAAHELGRLATLTRCGRCSATGADGETKCEKCLDAGWEIGDREPVTCGCGCWTRWQLEVECGLRSASQLEER